MIIVTPSFSESSFRPDESEKTAFSNSFGLKSVHENLRFRDGLVWTVGLTAEISRFVVVGTLPETGKNLRDDR